MPRSFPYYLIDDQVESCNYMIDWRSPFFSYRNVTLETVQLQGSWSYLCSCANVTIYGKLPCSLMIYQAVKNYFLSLPNRVFFLFVQRPECSMWSCWASINWISCKVVNLSNIYSLIQREDGKFRCKNYQQSSSASHFFFFKRKEKKRTAWEVKVEWLSAPSSDADPFSPSIFGAVAV